MVVPLHTESFSTLAQLESVYKSGDLIRHLRGLISSSLPRKEGDRFQKFENALYKTVVPTHTESFSILAHLESVQKSGDLKYKEKEKRHPKSNLAIFEVP